MRRNVIINNENSLTDRVLRENDKKQINIVFLHGKSLGYFCDLPFQSCDYYWYVCSDGGRNNSIAKNLKSKIAFDHSRCKVVREWERERERSGWHFAPIHRHSYFNWHLASVSAFRVSSVDLVCTCTHAASVSSVIFFSFIVMFQELLDEINFMSFASPFLSFLPIDPLVCNGVAIILKSVL